MKKFLMLAMTVIGSVCCDQASPTKIDVSTAPSMVVVTGNPGPSLTASTSGCMPVLRPAIDVTVIVNSSASNLFVDSVTLHMIDGSNLGGPMVTVPRPDLNAQFGDTLVLAGTSRRFGFAPAFVCVRSGSIQIEVVVVDDTGLLRSLRSVVALR